ncbi:MAG: MmgE/PrpD family protein [Halioglobus sp.]
MSLTRDLIRHIRNKPVDQDDLHRAALFTLDAIANAVAGRHTAAGKKLAEWGREQGDDVGRRAFVFGGFTHILETDDLHRASVTHPGCVVVPAAFSLAQRHGHSAHDVLQSVLAGFEAMCRIGMAVGGEHYKVWHNTATCGPFGSAMAAAQLLSLSEDQAVYALGNAGTQSAGLWEFLDTGAMSKHLHAGRAAEAGIVAAQLAALDFTGPPAILEGDKGFFRALCPNPEPSAVLSAPESPWQLTVTSIKPWPSCRHTHPAIDAALELRALIDGRETESVRVEAYQAALDVCNRPLPTSEYEAKFSLHHCVAAALGLPAVDFSAFDDRARQSLTDLRAKISIAATEPWVSAYPDAWGSRVFVTLTDGDQLTAQRSFAKGDPELPLTDSEMITKAEMLLAYAGLEENEVEQLIAQVMAMSDKESNSAAVPTVFSHLGLEQ